MKFIVICSALISSIAAPLVAQAETATAPAAAAAALSIDSPIEQIVANAAGKTVLDADFPGLTAHPAYEQFKGMTLKQLQPLSGGVITDDGLAKANTDLSAIK